MTEHSDRDVNTSLYGVSNLTADCANMASLIHAALGRLENRLFNEGSKDSASLNDSQDDSGLLTTLNRNLDDLYGSLVTINTRLCRISDELIETSPNSDVEETSIGTATPQPISAKRPRRSR